MQNNAVVRVNEREKDIDSIFWNENAGQALRAFQKFIVHPEEERWNDLAQTTAVTSAAVDSFKDVASSFVRLETNNNCGAVIARAKVENM